MARKQRFLTYEQKMIRALKSLPHPIEDKKHRIKIIFRNDRARSNQSRFEHIIVPRHELLPSDIKQIVKGVNTSILKKDEERTNTYNLFIKRNSFSNEYIKISMEIDFKKSNIAVVKTMFIIKNCKQM